MADRQLMPYAVHASSSITDIPNQRSPAVDVVQTAKAVGDALRANVLRALARDSFAVQELGDIFTMSQPAMSHHLKILADAGLVTRRREGTTMFYQRALSDEASWISGMYNALDADPLEAAVRRNIGKIHKARQQRSLDFFATEADALAQQTALICDPSVYAETVMNCLSTIDRESQATALEVGPGNGVLLKHLARSFPEVVGMDLAGQMLNPARLVTEKQKNVRLIEQDFNDLPPRPSFNVVVAAMVLHHMPSPSGFFTQAGHVLKHGGSLVIAELCPHDFDWVQRLCGDLWLGFEPDELVRWAADAGFTATQHQFLSQRNGFRVQVAAFALS